MCKFLEDPWLVCIASQRRWATNVHMFWGWMFQFAVPCQCKQSTTPTCFELPWPSCTASQCKRAEIATTLLGWISSFALQATATRSRHANGLGSQPLIGSPTPSTRFLKLRGWQIPNEFCNGRASALIRPKLFQLPMRNCTCRWLVSLSPLDGVTLPP